MTVQGNATEKVAGNGDGDYRRARLIAIVTGFLGAVLAIATPLLPVRQDTAELNWPQNGTLTSVDAPLIGYVPTDLTITVPCAAAKGLEGHNTVLLSTVPKQAPNAVDRGMLIQRIGGDLVVIVRNVPVVSAPLSEVTGPNCQQLQVIAHSDKVTGQFVGLTQGPKDAKPGQPRAGERGGYDFRPQIVGVFTDLSGPAPAGLQRLVHDAQNTEVLPGGLVLPPPFSFAALAKSPRFAVQRALLTQPEAVPQPYAEQVADLLALHAGTYRHPNGESVRAGAGEGSDLQLWIHGSSAGESARLAGARGLRFGSNYHVAPASVLEAVAAYREAFRPSQHLAHPYVIVSADVVVAEDADTARELARGYAPWVRSIRTGAGAIAYPTPDEAAHLPWSEADDALVADRVDTRFVGTAGEVADRLAALRDATDADELLVTTITHDHDDRVRSFQLLAKEWSQR